MKIIITTENKSKISFNKFIDWLIHVVAYALILITVSIVFKKTIFIDNSYFGLWGLFASIIIYLLNKTVKPIIVWLTLPITGLTLGLFYPFINVFILHITDWILGPHFDINGIFFACIVAILISVMNILMDIIVINPILERGNK